MKQIVRFWDKIILMLLGIVGVFSGCRPNVGECEPYDDPWKRPSPYPDSVMWVMYGVPRSDFAIKGTVTNKNGEPIPNIEVFAQTAYIQATDSKGNYYVANYSLNKEDVVLLTLRDIDGKENGGEFKSQEIKVKITDADREKMEQCIKDDGMFTKIQNVELKTKK